MHVSVGRDSVGSFSIRGGDVAISSSRDIVNCCVGRMHWMLVRFALSRKEEELDGFDKQYLEMLGFPMKSVDNQLALADGASECRKDRSAQAGDAVFVFLFVKRAVFFPNQLKAED